MSKARDKAFNFIERDAIQDLSVSRLLSNI